MKMLVLILLTLCPSVTGGFADNADVAKEWKLLAGDWQPVVMEIDGNKLDAEAVKEFKITFTEGKFVVKNGSATIDEGKLEIAPDKKPKHMDVTSSMGDNANKKRPGIYELKGDTMKFVMAPSDKERPTKFESPSGSGNIYIEYKKAK